MKTPLSFLPLLVLWGAACLPDVAPEPVADQATFREIGAVVNELRTGASASFDENRVVGPNVNVSRRADGSWAGVLNGQLIAVSPNGKHISGSMLSLDVKQKDDRMNVGGIAGNTNIRISLSEKNLEVRTNTHSFTLPRTGVETWGGGQVQLTGEAAKVDGPQPQLALAMLASF